MLISVALGGASSVTAASVSPMATSPASAGRSSKNAGLRSRIRGGMRGPAMLAQMTATPIEFVMSIFFEFCYSIRSDG